MIRVLGVIATGAVGIVAQAAVDPTTAWAGLEKLGIAGIVIAVLYWLLQQERAERRTEREERLGITARFEKLQEDIRKDHTDVISRHAEAMKENAAASKHLATVIGRCAGVGGRTEG